MTTEKSKQMQETLLSGNYQVWTDSASGKYYVSQGTDRTKLAGPFSSIEQIPASFQPSHFQTQNVNQASLIDATKEVREKVSAS